MASISMASCSGITGVNDERRIWLGNLDPRITEYQLLKLVQKCGKIEKFDMLFHKGGPLIGQSRGYAFITFATNEGAANALRRVDGVLVSNRPIVVRLAKNVNYDELERPKPKIEIPALGTGFREGKISKEETIRAIEAKLKVLERHSDDDFNLLASNNLNTNEVPFIQRFQFNKDRDTNQRRPHSKPVSAPYNRNHRSRRK